MIGYINLEAYYIDQIEITQILYRIKYTQIMERYEFREEGTTKITRKRVMEEESQVVCPQKRIKDTQNNNGLEYESQTYTKLNQASMQPIKTAYKDRGIDMIGEYKGITIWTQVKDYRDKVGAPVVQNLIGTLGNKKASIGVLVAKNGYTKEAVDVARNAQIKILLTDIPNLIDQITQQIDHIIISRQPRIEIIGESAEIVQTEQDGTKRTHIRNAKRVIIFH